VGRIDAYIRLFLTQVSLRQEFPIELKIPNKVTLEAMKENVTEKTYDSVDDLFNEVLSDAQH
jgi:DNA-damage-inducible protein J